MTSIGAATLDWSRDLAWGPLLHVATNLGVAVEASTVREDFRRRTAHYPALADWGEHFYAGGLSYPKMVAVNLVNYPRYAPSTLAHEIAHHVLGHDRMLFGDYINDYAHIEYVTDRIAARVVVALGSLQDGWWPEKHAAYWDDEYDAPYDYPGLAADTREIDRAVRILLDAAKPRGDRLGRRTYHHDKRLTTVATVEIPMLTPTSFDRRLISMRRRLEAREHYVQRYRFLTSPEGVDFMERLRTESGQEA